MSARSFWSVQSFIVAYDCNNDDLSMGFQRYILAKLRPMKIRIETKIETGNKPNAKDRYAQIPELHFSQKCGKLAPHSHKHEKACEISRPDCWFYYPKANLDGTTRTKRSPSIGPSFSSLQSSWKCRRGNRCNGTEIQITHPRNHGSWAFLCEDYDC